LAFDLKFIKKLFIISYQRLYLINGRATTPEMMKYRHALLLSKMTKEQNFNNRNTAINLVDTSKFKIDKKINS
jgi:hypothetical protein